MLIHSEICFFQLHSFSTHLTSYLSSLPPFWQESFPTVVSLLKLYFDIQGPSGRTLSCSLRHPLGLPPPSYPVSTPPSQQAHFRCIPEHCKITFPCFLLPVPAPPLKMEVWVFWLAISLSPVQQYKCEPTKPSPSARRSQQPLESCLHPACGPACRDKSPADVHANVLCGVQEPWLSFTGQGCVTS